MDKLDVSGYGFASLSYIIYMYESAVFFI